jgi:hypothetical protein
MAHSLSSDDVSSAVLEENDVPALLSKLHEFLPYPIPLYRRLQFHLKHPNPDTARAFLAIASNTTPRSWLRSSARDPPIPFLACHIDLSCAGETQIYTFASWEAPPINGSPQPSQETRTALFNTLFKSLATDPVFIPSSPKEPPESHQLLTHTKKLVTPYSPSKVLFGAIHLTTFECVPKHAHARTHPGFVKYIFPPPESDADEEILPEGYHFGPMSDNDDYLNLALSRTVIPRTVHTLRQLGSVGVFFDGEAYPTLADVEADARDPDSSVSDTRTAREVELSANAVDARPVACQLERMTRLPVAWAFLGKDASLTSLHVEPRHRGKNLAGAVTRKLFAMQEDVFGSEAVVNTKLGHADVFESNVASRRVMEKLGGESMWVVAWAEVEISKIVGVDWGGWQHRRGMMKKDGRIGGR